MENKTNAMRLLDRHKTEYRSYSYDNSRSVKTLSWFKKMG